MSGGFKFVKTQSQGDVTGKNFTYGVAATHATALASGDVIRISGTASTTGVPEADAATAAQSVTGVMAAANPTFAGEALSNASLAAITAGSILANVDPHALYRVDVTNGTLVANNVGLNIDIVATAASTTGGITTSNMSVDAGTEGTTQTLPFRIVAIEEDDAGTLGAVAIVRINNSTLSDGAAGV